VADTTTVVDAAPEPSVVTVPVTDSATSAGTGAVAGSLLGG
jgi:hypothetical protein